MKGGTYVSTTPGPVRCPSSSRSTITSEGWDTVLVSNCSSSSKANGSANGAAKGGSDAGEKKREYTPEQAAVVKRIRACRITEYYEILSVKRDCEEVEVKKAYRKVRFSESLPSIQC